MADYYMTFSVTIPLKSEAEKEWWREKMAFCPDEAFPTDEEGNWDDPAFMDWCDIHRVEEGHSPEDIIWPPFDWQVDQFGGPDSVWLGGEDNPNPEVASHVIRMFLEEFDKDGDRPVSLSGADTCSKLHSDGFGGFAYFITKDNVFTMDTGTWLHQKEQEFSVQFATPKEAEART